MSIKIIKEGKLTKFTKTCPDCGCEFEYDTTDLHTDYSICLTSYPAQYNTYVICPCCGKHIYHGTTRDDNWPNQPKIWYTNTGMTYGEWLDCDKCPNKPDPLHPVVGDTPCTWCKKNQPYCTDYTVTKK